ncbi:N-acetylmuramoyl-L-alanine amidase [Candidatus Dependentiae bacterium]|nr:N-acetylmuramoyl-L-alanine amidase [Candidatus Dependentiae bacterium]
MLLDKSVLYNTLFLLESAVMITKSAFPWLLLSATVSFTTLLNSRTIMLDPAGHAKQPGRQLHESFERAETYKCAELIKKIIEIKSNINVLITRAPGEEIIPLQNASFANRTHADLFVNIHLYKEDAEQPSINLAYLTYDTLLDPTYTTIKKTDFMPINQAHCPALATTKHWCATIINTLKTSVPARWHINPQALALPLKELQGVTAPAITIELGVHRDNEYQEIAEHLALAFTALNN